MPNLRKTRWSRWQRTIYRKLPDWLKLNDFQVFAAVLCFFGGLPLLVTDEFGAQSVEAALPEWLVRFWAATLVVGPIIILFGLWKATGKPISEVTFWLRFKAFGLKMLSYAGFIYTIAVAGYSATKGWPAILIILLFAVTCWVRATSVTIRVDDYLEEVGAK